LFCSQQLVLTLHYITSHSFKFDLCLATTTLADLKNVISQDNSNQRIFHLGRELKSSGRTLEKLGIGRFRNMILHLHLAPPKVIAVQPAQQQLRVAAAAASMKRSSQVIDLLDDSDDGDDGDDDDVAIVESPVGKRQRIL
jgi:hypothetical protein